MAWLSIYLTLVFSGILQTATLTVEVRDLRSARGAVHVSVYAREEGFPFQPEKALAKGSSFIQNGTAVVRFHNLKAGRYAVAVLHDENRNNRMDTDFGMPREGYGFSNEPKVLFGPPSFRKSAFQFSGAPSTIQIRVKYIN